MGGIAMWSAVRPFYGTLIVAIKKCTEGRSKPHQRAAPPPLLHKMLINHHTLTHTHTPQIYCTFSQILSRHRRLWCECVLCKELYRYTATMNAEQGEEGNHSQSRQRKAEGYNINNDTFEWQRSAYGTIWQRLNEIEKVKWAVKITLLIDSISF